MTNSDLLVDVLMQLDAVQARCTELERYYEGKQPLAFMAPEAAKALDNRFGRMASNIPRLVVTSLAERLRIIGFTGTDVWADWIRNDLDQLSMTAHRDALLFGSSFVIVWADSKGRPQVTIESPKQMQVSRDPGSREITAAVKRWRSKTQTFATLFLPDRIEKYVANSPGAVTAGFELVEVLDNPLGVVPVVELKNIDRIQTMEYWSGYQLFEPGLSEITDVAPLVDALNKVLADMMVTSEYGSRPRRWATGIELTEVDVLDENGDPTGEKIAVNPIPEGDRAMISEKDTARFGQLDAADLGGYRTAVEVLLSQIMAVSALPAHFVGIVTSNPSSAEAMRAAEASLTARAEARQMLFGRNWEQVARLIVAIRDSAEVDDIDVHVRWCDPSTASTAAQADAVVKLVQAGILSKPGAMRRMGYSESEIEQELYDTEASALAGANPEFSLAVRHHANLYMEQEKGLKLNE